jgi:essential nuclear protein 1
MPKAPSKAKSQQRQEPLFTSIVRDTAVVAKKKVRKEMDSDLSDVDENDLCHIPSDVVQKMRARAKSAFVEDSDSEVSESDQFQSIERVDQDGFVEVDGLDEDYADDDVQTDSKKREHEKGRTSGLPVDLMQLYTDMGKWLSTYRSGKMLKGLKLVPSLANWEEAVYLMNPLDWSAQAHFEACKIFVSNLKPHQAQRYLNLVLLPQIRENISEYKKLNFHYYEAVKKALYKPQAFFKGLLLPLALEGNCTAREAVIVSSVVTKMSIPVLHAAAALYKLCSSDMNEWSPAISIFISSLVGKKYALPMTVVEKVVEWFSSFKKYGADLPIIWQVGLLLFVQTYKSELDQSMRRSIKELLEMKGHRDIAVEVNRELETVEMITM